MSLDWHNPTSRSKHFGFFVFLVFIPVIAFYLGNEYYVTKQAYDSVVLVPDASHTATANLSGTHREITTTTSSSSAATKFTVIKNKRFGFEITVPSSWAMTHMPVQEKIGESFVETESFYSFTDGTIGVISPAKLSTDSFCSGDEKKRAAYIEENNAYDVTVVVASTSDSTAFTISSYFENQQDGGSRHLYSVCFKTIGFQIDGTTTLVEDIKNIFSTLKFN